ncbi:TauD/TfdA family dioxygenase [Nocardioidaceae bacterium]|nr:TauD/TfdA family dioxygenase [Nocardioidaceae bacterium]
MRVQPTEPLGARLNGVDLAEADEVLAAEVRSLLAEHGVLVVPDQHDLDDDQFTAFLRLLGELVFTVGETPVPGHPDLNVVSNVGRTTPPRSRFHVDTSYVSVPPAYTALRAVQVPAEGGATLFSDQYAAAATLPAALREEVQGRTATHVVTGLTPEQLGPDAQTSAQHPLLRRHPVSGRETLFLSTPQRLAAVSGLEDEAAADLVRRLLDHSLREDNLLRHAWSPGDVVVWDNGAVMHRADHSAVVGDRVMHRGMVAGTGDGTGAG